MLLPSIHYQYFLSTGDHGLNLYGAEAVLKGEKPYRDFHWFYGPLMLYYYSFFMKIFGISIPSVLIGQQFLILCSGILIYSALSLFISPFLAFAGATWFLVSPIDFFYTYNHTGGITLSFAIIYFILRFIQTNRYINLYLSLIIIFILGMLKLNFGFSSLLGLILTVFLNDKIKRISSHPSKKQFYIIAIFIFPIALIGANWIFLYDSPFYVIKQCYQYFGNDASAENYPSIGTNLIAHYKYLLKKLTSSWQNLILIIIFILSILFLCFHIIKDKKLSFEWKNCLVSSSSLILFYSLNLHELLISGIFFRRYWAEPFSIILIFLVIGCASKEFQKSLKIIVFTILVFIPLSLGLENSILIKARKIPQNFLPFPRAKVFYLNEPSWTLTVSKTLLFLKENLKPDETFFSLPYDPLYYFLSEKPSPTRQLVFFDFINIQKVQERKIIEDLEKNKINWIVLSNRYYAPHEEGLGIFGKDYCPLIAQYISDNFELIAQFGDWQNPSGWAWQHGTAILKRKPLK